MNDTDVNYNKACKAYEDKDYTTAYELFYDLAMQSDISCQVNVANMLLHGLGVEKNEDRAYEWFEQAALNEDKEAQYIHGWHCISKEDFSEGIKHIELSAKEGFLDAVYDLAGFYSNGLYGLDTDDSKASTLYEEAVLLGKKEALGALATSKKKELGFMKGFIYMMKNSSNFTKRVNPKS